MIRAIVAIDENRGLADDHGIPWQGRIPTDVKYYLDNIKTGTILMGYGVYKEMKKAYQGGVNYVAIADDVALSEGFEAVKDARAFLQKAEGLVWNVGGAGLFQTTFDLIDELYITQLEGDFKCTKFFPEYQQDFEKVSQSEPLTEGGITFRFTTWRRKPSAA